MTPAICEQCGAEMSPGTRGSPKRYCTATCRRIAWAIRHLPPEKLQPAQQQPERDPALFRPIYERR